MKGAEDSFSSTFEKNILLILFFKNRRKYKAWRCSWKIVLLKDIVVVMNLEDIIILLAR